VDIHGKTINTDDQGDAAAWPESNDVDGWFWEVEPDERAALEAAEIERQADLANGLPPGDTPWAAMMVAGSLPAISGGAPAHYEPTEAAWREYSEILNRIDAVERADTARQWYDRNPSFGDYLDREGGPAVG
jgi:hypothetical protein